jgi:hypothetical protein
MRYERWTRGAILAALLLGIQPTNSVGDEPLSMVGLNDRERTIFMTGVNFGFQYYNAEVKLGRKTPLFCVPWDGATSGGQLWQLASRELAGPHEPAFIVIAALIQLRQEYPCP